MLRSFFSQLDSRIRLRLSFAKKAYVLGKQLLQVVDKKLKLFYVMVMSSGLSLATFNQAESHPKDFPTFSVVFADMCRCREEDDIESIDRMIYSFWTFHFVINIFLKLPKWFCPLTLLSVNVALQHSSTFSHTKLNFVNVFSVNMTKYSI